MLKSDASRRLGERIYRETPGRIVDSANNITEIKIKDYSSTGARLEVAHATSIPKRFQIRIGRDGEERGAELVWRNGYQAGIRFILEAPKTPEAALAAVTPGNRMSLADLRKLAPKAR